MEEKNKSTFFFFIVELWLLGMTWRWVLLLYYTFRSSCMVKKHHVTFSIVHSGNGFCIRLVSAHGNRCEFQPLKKVFSAKNHLKFSKIVVLGALKIKKKKKTIPECSKMRLKKKKKTSWFEFNNNWWTYFTKSTGLSVLLYRNQSLLKKYRVVRFNSTTNLLSFITMPCSWQYFE